MTDVKWTRGYGEVLPANDEEGNFVGWVDTRGKNLSEFKPGNTVYSYDKGDGLTWVAKQEDIPTWVELNKDTGEIEISAPDVVFNSDWYQNKVKPLLTQLSSAYKSNQDYKMPNPFNENDEKKDYTVEEIVQKVQDGININQMSMGNFYRSQDWFTSKFGDAAADRYNINHYYILGANGLSGKDDALIAVPKSVSHNTRWKNFFEAAESFNDNTITVKDFNDKYYHADFGRDIFGYDNPHELKEFVREKIALLEKRGIENLSDEDVDEYMRLVAFNSYLSGSDTKKNLLDGSLLSGFAEEIWGVGEGAMRGTADLASGMISVADGIWNRVFGLEEGSEAYKRFANPLSKDITFASNVLANEISLPLTGNFVSYDDMLSTNTISEEIEKQYNDRAQFYLDTNKDAATWYMIGYMGTKVGENIIVGKAVSSVVTGALAKLAATKNVQTLTNMLNIVQPGLGALPNGLTASQYTNMMVTGVANPNAYQLVSGLSGIDAANAANMIQLTTNIASEAQNSFEFAKAAGGAASAVRAVNMGKVAATVGDVTLQAIVDASLHNPVATRKIIEGSANEEERKAIWENAAWTAGGYAAGILLGKIISTFPKSAAGKTANEAATRKLWQIEGWVSNTRDKIKEKFFGKDFVDNIKNPGKKQVAYYKQVMNKAGADIANSVGDVAKTSANGKAGTATAVAIRNMRAVENAVAQMQAGTAIKINEYMSDAHPAINNAVTTMHEETSNLAQLVKNAGLEVKDTKVKIEIGGVDANMGFDQSINKYIGNKILKNYLDNKIKAEPKVKVADGTEIPMPPTFTPEQKRSYPRLADAIAKAEETLPKDITDYISKTYIPSLQKAVAAISEYRVKTLGIDLEDEIEGIISSGMFGVNGSEYVPLMRITDAKKKFAEEMNGMASNIKTGFIKNRDTSPKSIKWGSEADFVSPALSVQMYLAETARDEINQTFQRAALNVAGIKNNVLFDGTKTGAARTYDNLKPALDKAVKDGLGEVKSKFDANKIAKKVLDEYTTEKAIKKAETQQKQAEKTLKSLETADLKVNSPERSRAFMSMSAGNIENILNDAYKERVKGGGYLNGYKGVATVEDAMLDESSWDKFISDSPIGVRRAIKRAVMSYSNLAGVNIDKSFAGSDIYDLPFISYDGIVNNHLIGENPSEEALDALRQYQSSDTGISAEVTNKFLINGRKNSKVDDLVNRLQDAFTKEIDTDVVLYSGISNEKQVNDLLDNVGKQTKLLGFTSSSTDFDYAKTFAEGKNGYVLRIYTPSGTNVAVMPENIAGANGELENEILFKNGLDVIVDQVHEPGDISEKGVIDLKIVGKNEPVDEVDTSLFDEFVGLSDSINSIDNPYLPAPIGDKTLKYNAFKLVSEVNPEVITDVNKAMIKADKDLYKSNNLITKIAQEQKRSELNLRATLRFEEASRTLGLPTKNSYKELLNTIDTAIDGVKDAILGDKNAVRVIDAIMVYSSDVDKELSRDYVAMVYIKNNEKQIKEAAEEAFRYGKFKTEIGKMQGTKIEHIQNGMVKEISKRIDDRLDDARNAFVAAGGETVDGDKVLKEIHRLMDDIEEVEHNANVIDYRLNGQSYLIETDPVVAKLTNYHVIDTSSTFEKVMNNPITRGMNRMARFFQVTASPLSWRNQGVRDPLSAFFGTGTVIIRDGMKHISPELAERYGESLVEQFKQWRPTDYKAIEEQVQKEGGNIVDKVIDTLFAYGTSTSQAATRTSYYRNPAPYTDTSENFWGTLEQTKSTLKKIINKAGDATDIVHQSREVYLRNAQFAKGLKDGLDAGMSLEDAMNLARFLRDNGTTNFRNQLYHLRALANTVNYFGAGMNGYTSFWRLFSLDPVGVSSRIFGGLVIPTIVATAWSLASDENRERYKDLKEYEKSEQFVFVMNGQVYRVPIPQEFSVFMDPIRHAVESLYGGNKHSFWELMMTDILNMGQIKFGDLMDLDRNEFAQDPTILDRLGSLGLSLIDQTFPLVLKTIFSFATGIDTYTGQPIDTSYYTFDEDGNRILDGGTQSKFSLALGNATGWSPSVIAWTAKSLFGTVGRDILDVVIGGETPVSLVSNAVNSMQLTASDYDRTASDWNKEIADLWNQKENKYLVAYNDYTDQINKETDPEKQKKLINKRKDAIQPFLDQVKNAVSKLNSKYPGMYDNYRFASVVSLLTFDSGSASGITADAKQRDLENFYANRDQAYKWMQDLGISGSDSKSILGHLERDNDGNVVVKMNSPLEILSAQSIFYGAKDIHVANIRTILESGTNSYKDQLQDVKDQISAIYDRGNLKQSDYDEIDDIKIEWDKKVIAALADYVNQATPEAAINNDKVIEYLSDYLYVPDAFKKNNKGYNVTNKSLNYLGSAEDAFKENFIKYAFGVNDRRYETGWNFSNRNIPGDK